MPKNKQRPVVVLIEDHPDIVRMYSVVFESVLDADVFVAEDVTDGMRLVIEKKPDILLLDLIIPIKKGDSFEPTSRNGFELLAELRQEKEFKKLPVFVMTNLESMEDRARAKELKTQEYIIKSQTLPNQVAKLVSDFLYGK